MKCFILGAALAAIVAFPALADNVAIPKSDSLLPAVTATQPADSSSFNERFAQALPVPGVSAIPAPLVVAPDSDTGGGGLLNVGQAFSKAVEPFVNAAIQSVLAAGLAWLAYWMQKRFNINISQAQQATVQTWLTNQASSLIADGAVSVSIVDGKPQVQINQQALTAHAQQYADQIPDAAKFFGLTPDALAAKIKDKIPQVPAGAQMIAKAAPTAA